MLDTLDTCFSLCTSVQRRENPGFQPGSTFSECEKKSDKQDFGGAMRVIEMSVEMKTLMAHYTIQALHKIEKDEPQVYS